MSTELITSATIGRMIAVYQQEIDSIERSYKMLEASWERLQAVAGSDKYRDKFCPLSSPGYYGGHWGTLSEKETKQVEYKIRATFWQIIIDRINPWPWLTEMAEKELYKWLHGDKLPPLTIDEILIVLESWQQNRANALQSLALEVFRFLKPGRWDRRKTAEKNRGYRLQKKIILTSVISYCYSGGIEAKYDYANSLNRMDSFFHLLDGTEYPTDAYNGPLVSAIKGKQSGEKFETEYFICKGYAGAGTLHITFKRPDLVRQLEALASDGRTLSQNRSNA